MRTFGAASTFLIWLSNLDAAPKKKGPFISNTSTPAGTSFLSIEFESGFSSSSSISRVTTLILETSAILFINNKIERTIPISIASVRSKITVRKKVVSKTITSLFGAFNNSLNDRHSLILYETITSIAARVAIGIRLAMLPREIIISNNVSECTIPATGVLPPFLILVAVLAIAPVAGIPPNNGAITLAAPCAISSMLLLCFPPIIPSDTTADNNDSIAANNAITVAGAIKFLITFRFIS